MAGIGLALQKLSARGSLADGVQALGYASLISCGPWLFTITCLGGITWFTALDNDLRVISIFGIIVIYNFCFSLVIFGPLVLIASRYLADCLYSKNIETIAGLCVGSLSIACIISLATAIPFYFFVTDLSRNLAAGAVVSYVLISMIWITSVFLHAVKNFGMALLVFFCGMTASFLVGVLLGQHFGATGILWGFNAGLFIIVYASLGIVLAQYRHRITRPFAFLPYFKKYWALAASGLVYNMAIWVDKWIMWFSAESTEVLKFMVFNPTYDLPMFLAYISIVPAMALFTFHTETHFFDHYNRFYREIKDHQAYSWIVRRCRDMTDAVYEMFSQVTLVQSVFTIGAIAFSAVLVSLAGGEFKQLGIFRIGVLGAFLQVMFLFITIVLFYFDLRVLSLCLQLLFLVSNALFTYASVHLGYAYYGYGYFLASFLSCLVAVIVLVEVLKRLPYITFVANNPSVR